MAWSVFERHFVWTSSEASIAAGKVSVLALAEAAASVAVYWWIAAAFDTYLHILISVIVAPFVLLRSDPAVDRAIEWYGGYWDAVFGDARPPRHGVAVAAASGLCGALAVVWLWPPQGAEDAAVFRAVATVLAAAALGLAAGGRSGGLAAGFAAVPVAAPGAWGWLADWFGGPYGLTDVLILAGLAIASLWAIALAIGIGMLVIFPLALMLRAGATRVVASLRYLPAGVNDLPRNWARTVAQTDILLLPELVPGLNRSRPDISPGALARREFSTNQIMTGDAIYGFLFTAIYLGVLFLPSVLWRYSLKSTAWLYLPLVYLAALPRWFADPGERMVRLRTAPSILDWLGIGYAVLSIAVAVLAAVDLAALLTERFGGGAEGVPLPLNVLFVLDFSRMRAWDWLALATAVLLLADAEWRSRLRNRMQAGGAVSADGWQPRALVALARLRVILVLGWIGSALYCSVGWLRARGDLPGWAEMLVGWCPCACAAI